MAATEIGKLEGLGTSVAYIPDQVKEEFTDADYVNTMRSIAAQYNWSVVTGNLGTFGLDKDEIGLPFGFATRSWMWWSYYFGEQNNITYGHYLLNPKGERLMSKMFRGKNVFKFVNYTIDAIIEMCKRIPKVLGCNIMSENVVSHREMMLDIGKFLIDRKESAKLMDEQFKMWFETGNGIKFMGDAKKDLETVNFREDLSIAAVNIARDIYYRNKLNEKFVDCGKNSLITGLAGTLTEVVNGYIQITPIMPFQAIIPVSTKGDQHREDPFGGMIDFLTIPEIAAIYGSEITKDQLKDLETIAKTGSNTEGIWGWGYYNQSGGPYNFNWYSDIQGAPRVAVVKAQWASWSKEEAEEHRQCVRGCTIIGNKYLIRQGKVTNIVKDWRNPSETMLDYQWVQPMSIWGRNMGIPEIIHNYENRIDALRTKVDEWANQTKGTFYLINGSYLDEHTDAVSLMADISRARVAVVQGMDTDAGQDKAQRLMEQGAIEMPRDYASFINEINYYTNLMADILNIPDAARGQIQGYVPQKTLDFQSAQSGKGTKIFYESLYVFFNRVMQKAVDKFVMSTEANPDFEYNLFVSDTQTVTFKAMEGFGINKFGVFLGFEDVADEGYKQRALEIMFNYTQNPQSGYNFSDYLAIEKLYTKNEIENYFEYRDLEIKRERFAAEQAAAKQAQVDAEENRQSQELINTEREAGADQRQTQKLENDQIMQDKEIIADMVKGQPS